jgi:hypothetical protein
MKVHLVRPNEDGVTMCGIKHTKAPTTSIADFTTCKRCLGMYQLNVDWYEQYWR